jgi:hypothetical protein
VEVFPGGGRRFRGWNESRVPPPWTAFLSPAGVGGPSSLLVPYAQTLPIDLLSRESQCLEASARSLAHPSCF